MLINSLYLELLLPLPLLLLKYLMKLTLFLLLLLKVEPLVPLLSLSNVLLLVELGLNCYLKVMMSHPSQHLLNLMLWLIYTTLPLTLLLKMN